MLTFRVTLIFLAYDRTGWALKAVKRSQKLSRSTRPSPTSCKTLASLCYGHFPQRYRGGNAKFSGIQNLLTFRVTLISLALGATSLALKAVQRLQKLSRSTRPSPTSSKAIASPCHAHFPERYRGGNAKFSGIQNSLTFRVALIFLAYLSTSWIVLPKTGSELLGGVFRCRQTSIRSNYDLMECRNADVGVLMPGCWAYATPRLHSAFLPGM